MTAPSSPRWVVNSLRDVGIEFAEEEARAQHPLERHFHVGRLLLVSTALERDAMALRLAQLSYPAGRHSSFVEAAACAQPASAGPTYSCRRPELGTLYQVVRENLQTDSA
jgi:hypothetical protein